jgi:hypothetical protein
MPNFISEDQIERALVQKLQHLHGFDVLGCHKAASSCWYGPLQRMGWGIRSAVETTGFPSMNSMAAVWPWHP